jgi:hypothetical protein
MLTLLGSAGCAYKVRINTSPAGAELTLPSGETVITPNEVTLRWAPFNHQELTARAAGFRELTIDMRREEVRWGHYLRDILLLHTRTWAGQPRGTVSLVMIPEHDGVGTWTAEEVP